MVEAHPFALRVEPGRSASRSSRVAWEEPAPRMTELYACPRGHLVDVTLSSDIPEADIPAVWQCRHHGTDSKRLGYEDDPLPPVPYRDRARGDDGRTHFDRLLERRSRLDLDALLRERLRAMGCTLIDYLPAPAAGRVAGSGN